MMAKSPEDTPQAADLQHIPRWARVALLGRTLRRIQPLLLASWPKATKKCQQSVEWAISESELAAAQAAPTPDIKDAGMAALNAFGAAPRTAEAAGDVAFASARACFVVRQLQAGSAPIGLRMAVQAVSQYERDHNGQSVTSAVVAAIWSDYNDLKSLAKKNRWTDKSPVSPDVFGPLWPKGLPKNWPTDLPEPAHVNPQRRRKQRMLDERDLPQEAIEFLKTGNQFEFDSTRMESGAVALKPFSHLQYGEFTLSTEGTPARRKDPHKGHAGDYILRVIDLVGECENHDPDGLLAWFPDYKLFGGYDVDHHTALVFPKASWSDIVASPAKYLNAQWYQSGAFARSLPNPWEYCDFRSH